MEETTTCVRGFSHRRTYAMCRFAFAGALVLLGLPAARAEAAPIVFDFMVKFTGGTNSTLSGQSFEGSLSGTVPIARGSVARVKGSSCRAACRREW